jgi:hypothetical protein
MKSIVLTNKPNDIAAHIYGTVKNVDGCPIHGAQVE